MRIPPGCKREKSAQYSSYRSTGVSPAWPHGCPQIVISKAHFVSRGRYGAGLAKWAFLLTILRRHLCAHTSRVGVNRHGAFAEYISLPMSNVWEHRPGIDLDIVAIFDPFGNAVHTALQFDLLDSEGFDAMESGQVGKVVLSRDS